MSRYFVVLISFIIFISPSTYASRLALVIGNGDYHYESSLDNPVNDATDIAAVLENLGFEVILKRNAKRRAMIRAVQNFGKQLSRHDVGLFYYSGHGLQAGGENFLVPVNAEIKSKADIEFESVPANRILRQMEEANNGVNIVILDACRDNPFTTNQKGFRKGLAKMDSPTGSLIAFATAPNTSAWGGQSGERNSIYTKHFLKALQNQAHLSITDLFTQVRKDVIRETKGETKQVPWESVSLTERFCFRTCGETGTVYRLRATKPDISTIDKSTQFVGIGYEEPIVPRTIKEIIVIDTQTRNIGFEIRELKKYRVAYHYLIGPYGSIKLLVEESNVAHHTDGRNKNSIGIGLIHVSGKKYSSLQLDSLISLLVDIVNRHNVRLSMIRASSQVDQKKKSDFPNILSDIQRQVKTRVH